MADKKNSTQPETDAGQIEKEKLESVKKADAAVKSMSDFTSPEVLYQELISSVKKYHPSTDISMIQKAYEVAREAHKDQKRKSGEPYIIHPLCVAIILADLELDKETIVAGLLHKVDVIPFVRPGNSRHAWNIHGQRAPQRYVQGLGPSADGKQRLIGRNRGL